MGTEAGDKREAEVTERLCPFQDYVGEETEAGRCSKSRQKGISMSGAFVYPYLYVRVLSMQSMSMQKHNLVLMLSATLPIIWTGRTRN